MAQYFVLFIMSFSTSVPNLVLLSQNAQLLCYVFHCTTPCCVITLTKIFMLHTFLVGTWLRFTTGWVTSADSVTAPHCVSTGPHLGWLLAPVGVGNCSDDVWNVGHCQRGYFRITCFLRSFWIRGSLVVWTLPFSSQPQGSGSHLGDPSVELWSCHSMWWPLGYELSLPNFLAVASSSSWSVVA